MSRATILSCRTSRQISPLYQTYAITISHQIAVQQSLTKVQSQSQGIRFKSTTKVKDIHSKTTISGKTILAKTLGPKPVANTLRDPRKLLSKPPEHQTQSPSFLPALPTSDKIVTVQSAASLKSKNGSTTNSMNTVLHRVAPDILYPGDTQLLRLPWGGVLSYARLGR
jgi:hypothetical protein